MDIEKAMMARSLLEEIDRLKELSSFFEVSDIRQVKVTIAHVEREKPIMACRIYDSTGDKGYTDMYTGDELCKSKPAKPYFELKG